MTGTAALRLLRLANPLVRLVLGSAAHRLLSGRLVVLEYRGRRSRRLYRIPLRYAVKDDEQLVAIAVRPERKEWWRSFAPAATATLTLRGRRVATRGALAQAEARESALGCYLALYPRSERLARDAAVVVFEPIDG